MLLKWFKWTLLFGLSASVQAEVIDPELTTQRQLKQAVIAPHAMVVTANPHASAAALKMLQQGGSAVDAAIAAQMVLNLVEPQSSGIGGGAFMLHFEQKSQHLTSFDGRETAPQQAQPDRFLQPDGTPMQWRQAWGGGRSVGVPGVVAMLAQSHQRYGKLAWAQLFQPAIELANHGFAVSERLASLLAHHYNPWLLQLEPARSYFYPNGQPLAQGQLLKNSALARTFTAIAKQGPRAFYHGPIAQAIAHQVQQVAISPGDLTTADLARYQAIERKPLCGPYHQFTVCGMGPPSSGGLAISQLLGLLEPFDMSSFGQLTTPSVHLFTQASRLAFADRNRYVGDSDFVTVPSRALTDEHYLQQRRQLILATRDSGKVAAGQITAAPRGKALSPEQANTSHLSIVDAQGNVVSMTTSIEMAFGSGVMVGGFLLNNQLTDFSFTPKEQGEPVANAVAGGKRPRSSMAPVIVFDDKQQPYLVLGSPGGSRIIDYVAQTLVGVLAGNLNLQQAINLPKVTNRNDYTALEQGRWSQAQQAELTAMQHTIKLMDLNSGLHGIQKVKGGWLGAADERREGVALGN